MADIGTLLAIMARLRDPNGGCPWDLEQDFESISPHTIEEAYEVDDAIARQDLDGLRDELGDLLFQVVFQARLGEEAGAFSFGDVVASIVDKLVRRHPHVFADATAPETVADQRASWEDIKAAERAAAGGDDSAPPDPFEGIPRRLPALARSTKIAGRAERLLPDRATPPGSPDERVECLRSLAETAARIAEALEAHSSNGSGPSGDASFAHLVGEGLGSWVRMARHLGIDPEQALRRVDDEKIARLRARSASSQSNDAPGR